MKKSNITILILLALHGAACSMPTEGTGNHESSESSESGDGSSSAGTGSEDAEESSESGDSSSGDPEGSSSSATDGSSETTGAPEVVDFALQFSGKSHVSTTGPIGWGSESFTVEAWIEIVDDGARGILVDQQGDEFDSGWMLCFHPESGALFGSFFDENGLARVASGPSASEIGVGWHHVSLTSTGTALLLHVDGVSEAAEPGSQTAKSVVSPIRIGSNPNAGDEWGLHGVTIDDVRVTSGIARYASNFDPSVVLEYDDLAEISLLVTFDEGEGASAFASDGLVFAVEGASWVPGLAD